MNSIVQMIEEKINDLHFPSSAKVLIDAQKYSLHHTWRTKYTATIARHEEFAVLTQIPLPQRIFFRFDDITKSGVPLQDIVRGGLQKHLNISEIKLHRKEMVWMCSLLDLRTPAIKPNLKRRFK